VSALEKHTAIVVQTPVAGEFAVLLKAVDDFDLGEIERSTVKLQQRLAAVQ
jgi:hypothetical protein